MNAEMSQSGRQKFSQRIAKLIMLLGEKPRSTRQLMRQLDCSRRTIQRDLEALGDIVSCATIHKRGAVRMFELKKVAPTHGATSFSSMTESGEMTKVGSAHGPTPKICA